MTQDDIARRLLLTSEICQQLQLYAQEITRENASRAYLEAFATRALKRCAQLYVLSRSEAFDPPEVRPVSPTPDRTEALAELRLIDVSKERGR
ncbi:MAG TPA: hypothetical protein PKV98_16275 [Burkholderiaceae bacterium]|nr:hypothetical protein [Burkholderiaceae bacterium]